MGSKYINLWEVSAELLGKGSAMFCGSSGELGEHCIKLDLYSPCVHLLSLHGYPELFMGNPTIIIRIVLLKCTTDPYHQWNKFTFSF